MKRIKTYLKDNYHIVMLLLMFGAVAFVVWHTNFWGDDYRYYRVALCDWKEIFQFLKWHMQNYNGRTLVHFLVVLSFRSKASIYIWRIFSAVSMCLISVIIAKITSNNKQDFRISSSMAVMMITGTIPFFWELSVYWQTGWFNYIFPLLLLLSIILLCRKKPDSFLIFPLSFICGATTEQYGLMTTGLFVLLIADYAIKNKKFNARFFASFILAAIGFATVVMSPGTYSRVGDQGKLSVNDLFVNLITIIRKRWIDNLCIEVVLVALNFFIVYWMIKFRKTNKFTSKVNLPLGILVSVFTVLNLLLKAVLVLCDLLHKEIVFSDRLNNIFFAVWIVYAALFITALFYSALLIYLFKSEVYPLIGVILGLGSQFMLIVSEASMYRTCVPAYFMFFFFVLFSANCFAKDCRESKNKKVVKYFKFETILAVLCICTCVAQGIVGTHALPPDSDFVNQKEFPLASMNSEEMDRYTDFLVEERQSVFSSTIWIENFDIKDFTWYHK